MKPYVVNFIYYDIFLPIRDINELGFFTLPSDCIITTTEKGVKNGLIENLSRVTIYCDTVIQAKEIARGILQDIIDQYKSMQKFRNMDAKKIFRHVILSGICNYSIKEDL